MGDKIEEDVIDIKGFSYNMVDGKIEKTKLTKESIFTKETSEHWKQLKITMPDVREGTVFEISYKVSSPFIFNLQSWTFQKSIPVVYSEYTTMVPEYLHYNKNVKGYFPITDHQITSRLAAIAGRVYNERGSYLGGPDRTQATSAINFTESIEKWMAKDVPAFKEEPYLTDPDNFKTAITFELAYTKFPNSAAENFTTSWEDINRKLMESSDFGGALDKTGFLKSVLPIAIADAQTDEQKIAHIYQHVLNKVKWNEKKSLFTSTSLKSTYENGTGNSADINLLMIAMLKEAGLTAHPVTVSTRDHGMVFPTSPTITSFNYVIAAVKAGGQPLLIDATARLAPLGILPFRCLNGSGRLINESGGQWVDLISSPEKKKTIAEYHFDLNEQQVSGKHTYMYYDQAAFTFRNQYLREDGTTNFKKEMQDKVSGLQIQSVAFDKMEAIGESPSTVCEITLEDGYTSAGEMIYFNPLFFDSMKSNPFKLEKRDYPVDYGVKSDDFYYAKINLPEGYIVESLPEEISIVLPERAAEYVYSATSVGNIISIRSQMKINKIIFTAEHYADLKNFYDLVVKKQAEQIVLKKA
ncbi:MAG: DUF3857 domain-containing protein [Saprospiraceae bacterium]|nr:DUF3857 domain-containing protein [Saprospiraceae bacterium]